MTRDGELMFTWRRARCTSSFQSVRLTGRRSGDSGNESFRTIGIAEA